MSNQEESVSRSDLSEAVERVEQGMPLYVWRENVDSRWHVTDWDSLPNPNNIEGISDLARVDLLGPSRVGDVLVGLSFDNPFLPSNQEVESE